MENLKTKITIKSNSNELNYIYDKNQFEMLDIQKNHFDGLSYLTKKSEIKINHKNYIVEDIQFVVHEETYNPNEIGGVNFFGNKQSEYNCELIVIVAEI